ncbi:MAG TPA: DUF2298 domain-containing protein [Opitutaceae bacterium]|jgi:hypothetical protein
MSLVFVALAVVVLWVNLAGAGLAARRLFGDYSVSRAAALLFICLACFCTEHFWGLGPRLWVLPFTTTASLWLIWRCRHVIRENRGAEGLFALGFLYCFLWRFTFPDINSTEDKMPNLCLIEGYMRGVRLPAPDLWLYPYLSNNYYSFQHYCAALIGRLLGVGPGVSYHLGFCAFTGLMVMLIGCGARALCPWRPGRWTVILALLVGGSGVAACARALIKEPYSIDMVRFLGGSIMHNDLTPLGERVSGWMTRNGVDPRDLPMEPLSYFLTKGDFHPPLSGFLLLAFAAALMALLEADAPGVRRRLYQGMLAATVPVALISNAWVLPLQCLLVGGWYAHCFLSGRRGFAVPALAGAGLALALEIPFLMQFTQQAIGGNASIGVTGRDDHTPLLGWLITFWPVLGVMAMAFFNSERRRYALFLAGIWAAALFASEFLFNHDVYGGAWSRFNSTLKWWQWVYAGVVVTLGPPNLGSRSRLCRFGTVAFLLPTLVFAYDLGVQYHAGLQDYARKGHSSVGRMSGAAWVEADPVIRDMISELSRRPDGVTVESGLRMENTDSPAVTLFSNKQSLLGWPWLEDIWRGGYSEVILRWQAINALYDGTLDDPLGWLLHNNVRYILWLPRDNVEKNAHFGALAARISGRYYWHHMYGNDKDFAVGFWERTGPPRGP